MTELPASLGAWRRAGDYFSVDGLEVFFLSQQSDQHHLPWLVCFHGFPTSSWDWHRLLPLLQDHWRVLVFDFPGYGLSAKPPRRDYSLLNQLDVIERLLIHLGIQRFDLLAHDMGNSVACELLFRRESGSYLFALNSLTLLNGGIYMDLHRPLLTQRLLRTPWLGMLTARLSSWRIFRLQYPRVYAHPEQFGEQHFREQWALLSFNEGRKSLAGIAGYMRERVRRGERWTGPLHRLDVPVRLLWGMEDPIAVPAIARRLKASNPAVELHELAGVGHYPQLEAPDAVAACLLSYQHQAAVNGSNGIPT